MKKIITIVMFFLFIVSVMTITIAEEDFIIHDGIKFGDSKDVVLWKETLEKVGHINYDEGDYAYLLFCEGQLAGYDDGRIAYLFNNDDKLVVAGYSFGYEDRKYAEIHETLKKKYGEQMLDEEKEEIQMKGGIYGLFTNQSIDDINMIINIDKEEMWRVEYNEYNVIIQFDVVKASVLGIESGDIISITYIYESKDRERYDDL